MNTKNLLLYGLVGGVITLALTNIPVINLVNFLICAGFWIGPLFAVWLYKRQTGSISRKEGIWVGVASGIISGVIGFVLSFVGVAGLSGLINQLNLVGSSSESIDIGGVGGVIANMVFTCFGIVFDIVVGAIAGWIGSIIFKDKPQPAAQIVNQS